MHGAFTVPVLPPLPSVALPPSVISVVASRNPSMPISPLPLPMATVVKRA